MRSIHVQFIKLLISVHFIMSQSFYDIADPQLALEAYLASHDNLYDHTKCAVLKRLIKRFYPTLTDLSILEVGPGGGIWTKYFLESGARVTCVDILPQILEANKKENPGIEIIVGDATIVNIPKKFDIVFAKDIIEHIPDDMLFLENMNRHLKDGGRIIINTQNSWSLNYLIQGGYHHLKGNHSWYGWDHTHVRFYDFYSLRRKLQKSFFTPKAWFGSYYFPFRLLAEYLHPALESKIFCFIEFFRLSDRLPCGIFGWNIGVVAQKKRMEQSDREFTKQ